MYAYNEAAVAEMNFAGVPGMVGRALMVAATNKIVDDINYYGHKGEFTIRMPYERSLTMNFHNSPAVSTKEINGRQFNTVAFAIECEFTYPVEERLSLSDIKSTVKNFLGK